MILNALATPNKDTSLKIMFVNARKQFVCLCKVIEMSRCMIIHELKVASCKVLISRIARSVK